MSLVVRTPCLRKLGSYGRYKSTSRLQTIWKAGYGRLQSFRNDISMKNQGLTNPLPGLTWKDVWNNRMIYMNEMNRMGITYGLFGVSVGNPSSWVVSLITYINSLGLPYWEAIVAGLPLLFGIMYVKASKQSMKVQKIQPELDKIMERNKLAQAMGVTADMNASREEMMNLYSKAGVSPVTPMLGSLIQLPVVMACFMGIRKLCVTVPAIHEGGLGWFVDLGIADPYYILPTIAGLSTLFMTELGADGMNSNGQVTTKYVMRGMSIFTIFIASSMPSGLCLYWIVNSAFAGIQTLCINPTARATLKKWLRLNSKTVAIPPPPPKSVSLKKSKKEPSDKKESLVCCNKEEAE